MTTRTLIERVTARVFCHAPGGGNPVTVFSSQVPLSASTQERLAQECEWESVMVASSDKKLSGSMPRMSFYMPSGEEVSFCAHAALGGASAVAANAKQKDFSFSTSMTGDTHTVTLQNDDDKDSNENNHACLRMAVPFEANPVSHPPGLTRVLRDHLGLTQSEHLTQKAGKVLPTFLNASVARPKTLVYVNSLEALAKSKTPKVITEGKRFSFASACGSIDDSTGIYLYAQKDKDSWECRQFPRASGYPEDPATGIAAAALAASLFKSGVYVPVYKLFQGTTMGRPSLIEVVDLKETAENSMISFGLQGRVEIDERDTVEVDN
jgi:PhzF family phenazine biosynthesis protein